MLSERWQYFWYELLSYPAQAAAFWGFSFRSEGHNNVPKNGGLLVIANHQSYLDPPLVGLAVRRHLTYLAKKTLFDHPSFRWLIESLGATPINQETAGTEGVKAALSLLKAGKATLVFPEGSRTHDGQIHPLKPGIVVLIRRANVPVLPVGIAGAYEAYSINQKLPRFSPLFMPANGSGVAVVVGKPIPAADLTALPPERMLETCRTILSELRQEAERLRRKAK